MPTNEPMDDKPRTQIKDLPEEEKELTREEQEKVKGGLLPYVEQDNIYKSTNVTDGTSNTIIKK